MIIQNVSNIWYNIVVLTTMIRSSEVNLPTTRTDKEKRWEAEKKVRRESRRERQKEEDAGARKGGTVLFQ